MRHASQPTDQPEYGTAPSALHLFAPVEVRGKFLFMGRRKLFLRGVTYGTFCPNPDGEDVPSRATVARDFQMMVSNGINAVRTYTPPPIWLLDLAQRYQLHILVGLPWEEHVTFLDDKQRADAIVERVRNQVRACLGHPAILGFTIGNEIPAPIVRWHGARAIERFLQRLYRAVKAEATRALVTYVNYPSTEYLELPFLDFVSFNVYLESPDSFSAYLARLQNLALDRPLVLAEIGLDSRRNGQDGQADALGWQLRAGFAGGIAGAFVFAWTDDWHRGGHDVDDWDFGLTDRHRRAKPALSAVRGAFAAAPFPAARSWPRVSVVVCSYNGAATIGECLYGLRQLDYPDYEVIVVDDGSRLPLAPIASAFGFRTITTPNLGLSHARNVGLEAATGEIIAYIDDDARPDPHWLTYLAATFATGKYVGVGGPNVPPPDQRFVEDCVANAPGGPVHVLLSDSEAEHIPGCNMAFLTSKLREVGGFDPQFKAAGDDVDVCWRVQAHGGRLGFSASALVWHRRRDSIRAYWRQQLGYGAAEALLARKWPEKYNHAGHLTWTGRLYGLGLPRSLTWPRGRIYQGPGGSAPFQSLYQPATGFFWSLPLMPEWYVVIAVLAGLTALGFAWMPMFLAGPLLVVAIGALLAQAVIGARKGLFQRSPSTRIARPAQRVVTTLLYLIQPLARLCGRWRHGLVPWRRSNARVLALPRSGATKLWSEDWRSTTHWLSSLEGALRRTRVQVQRGGAYDRWDFEAHDGILAAARAQIVVEEHGGGRQLVRVRWWPVYSTSVLVVVPLLTALAGAAARGRSLGVSALFAFFAAALMLRASHECGTAVGAVRRGSHELGAT